MKLSQESVRNLKTLLQTVSLVKIDRMIIEPGKIRGVDEDQTVVIVHEQNVPDFGGATVGLNRLSILANRINLFDANEDFTVECVESPSRDNEGGTDISSFKLAAKGSKFEYRAGRAGTIKAPRMLNDTFVWSVSVPVDAVKIAISAANTMGSDQIALVSKASGEILFEIVDGTTQDSFTTKIADEATWMGEDDEPVQSFVNYYAVKALMPLLKAAATQGDVTLLVGEEGMLQITVNSYTLTLLPRESEE